MVIGLGQLQAFGKQFGGVHLDILIFRILRYWLNCSTNIELQFEIPNIRNAIYATSADCCLLPTKKRRALAMVSGRFIHRLLSVAFCHRRLGR